MLEEDDLVRFFAQRRGRGVRFEADLHPLPVALVEVVELVEVPEEPVLQDEAGVARFAGDVGVGGDRRPVFVLEPFEVPGVDAGVAERLAVEVEVVVLAETGDVGRGRRPPQLFQTLARDESFQPDGLVAEHGVDAGRLVLLGGRFAGRVPLFAQHRDRRELLGQLLSGGFGAGGACRGGHQGADGQRGGRGGKRKTRPGLHRGQSTSAGSLRHRYCRPRMPPVFWIGLGIAGFVFLVGVISGARSTTTGVKAGALMGLYLGVMLAFPLLAIGLATS